MHELKWIWDSIVNNVEKNRILWFPKCISTDGTALMAYPGFLPSLAYLSITKKVSSFSSCNIEPYVFCYVHTSGISILLLYFLSRMMCV